MIRQERNLYTSSVVDSVIMISSLRRCNDGVEGTKSDGIIAIIPPAAETGRVVNCYAKASQHLLRNASNVYLSQAAMSSVQSTLSGRLQFRRKTEFLLCSLLLFCYNR